MLTLNRCTPTPLALSESDNQQLQDRQRVARRMVSLLDIGRVINIKPMPLQGLPDEVLHVRRRRAAGILHWLLALSLAGGAAASPSAGAADAAPVLLQAPWAGQLGWGTLPGLPCSWSGVTCNGNGTISSV